MQHTIKGRMAYAPVVLRLRPGYSENNVQGEIVDCSKGAPLVPVVSCKLYCAKAMIECACACVRV